MHAIFRNRSGQWTPFQLLASEMPNKRGPGLSFRDEGCGKYPDFEKLAQVIKHGVQGFVVKNIEGGSTETNDLNRIL